MSPTIRRDIEDLIAKHHTNTRSHPESDVRMCLQSLVSALEPAWSFTELSMQTHLYRQIRWNQAEVDRYRECLELIYGVELSQIHFLCARTIGDAAEQVLRALHRDGRTAAYAPPAA